MWKSTCEEDRRMGGERPDRIKDSGLGGGCEREKMGGTLAGVERASNRGLWVRSGIEVSKEEDKRQCSPREDNFCTSSPANTHFMCLSQNTAVFFQE